MEKQQEYKIGAAANEFVNEHRAELSPIKKAELEAMLKDFAIQQVKKLNIDDVSNCLECYDCGGGINDEDNFCRHCGEEI